MSPLLAWEVIPTGGYRRTTGSAPPGQPPSASIVGPTTGVAGFVGPFSVQTANGTASSVTWTVDGQTAGSTSAITPNLSAGTRTVSVSVTFATGGSATASTQVVVTSAPVPGITHGQDVGPGNTGPRASQGTLTLFNGTFRPQSGQTYTGLDIIDGNINASALSNVTFRDCRITARRGDRATSATGKLVNMDGANGINFEYCELNGNLSCGSCIGGSAGDTYRFRLSNCDVYGGLDNVKVGDGSTIEYSWLHDLERSGADPHCDILQLSGGSTPRGPISIRYNRLEAFKSGDFMNAVWQIGSFSTGGGMRDARFEFNYGNGGNFSIQDNDTNGLVVAGSCRFGNNRWGTDTRYPANTGAYDGRRIYSSLAAQLDAVVDWATETWADTGALIRPDKV